MTALPRSKVDIRNWSGKVKTLKIILMAQVGFNIINAFVAVGTTGDHLRLYARLNEAEAPVATNASFLSHHWVCVIRDVPLHEKSQMLHVHHVCIKGGQSGLAVPHVGGVIENADTQSVIHCPIIRGHLLFVR